MSSSKLRAVPALETGPLGIAGVGLIGGSIGLALRAVDPQIEVLGFDCNREHIDVALRRGAITRELDDLAQLVRISKTIALCGPVHVIIKQLRELSALYDAKQNAVEWPQLIFDVASVKESIARAGDVVPHFVASHPMAGSHERGPAAARHDLFSGRSWSYDLTEDPALNARMHAFIEMLGARPRRLASQLHDQITAASSHLPQAVSTLLAVHMEGRSLHGMYGRGLEDMLRLAHSPAIVWSDIFEANADAIASELDTFAHEILIFAEHVRERDAAAVNRLFQSANAFMDGLRSDHHKEDESSA